MTKANKDITLYGGSPLVPRNAKRPTYSQKHKQYKTSKNINNLNIAK